MRGTCDIRFYKRARTRCYISPRQPATAVKFPSIHYLSPSSALRLFSVLGYDDDDYDDYRVEGISFAQKYFTHTHTHTRHGPVSIIYETRTLSTRSSSEARSVFRSVESPIVMCVRASSSFNNDEHGKAYICVQ